LWKKVGALHKSGGLITEADPGHRPSSKRRGRRAPFRVSGEDAKAAAGIQTLKKDPQVKLINNRYYVSLLGLEEAAGRQLNGKAYYV